MPDPITPARPQRALARAATLAIATVALATSAGLPAAQADTAPAQVGTVPAVPSNAVRTAGPSDDTPIQLSVHLQSRDEAGAKALAAAVTDSSSPQYRHYLPTGEFAKRFGADPAAVAKVRQALQAQGLQPGALEADGLTLPVSTTTGKAKQAFSVNLAGYRLADGTTGYANTNAPTLRGAAAGSVAAVVGLNTLAKVHSNHVGGTAGVPTAAKSRTGIAPNVSNSGYPQLCQSASSQFPGMQEGKDYFSASSLAGLYGMNGFTDGGAGSTVAIFALEDYSDAGLSTFQSCYGTSASVQRVKVDGGPVTAPDGQNFGVESALDLDTVIGLAPKANVMVYQGPDYTTATPAQIEDTYRKIVTDNTAQVISTSWGVCDQVVADSDLSAENDIFVQAAVQGQTVVAASGDNGSSSCHNINDAQVQGLLSADDPASQPYVTGVGGTTLVNNGGSPAETVWNHNGGASGGGVSRFRLPDAYNYQAGFTGPGYSATPCAATAGTTCRQSPDVAAVADPATGYIIALDTNKWMTIGGTSGAAPLWAAIAAHLDSSGVCSGRVGLLNQSLYKAARNGASPLHDITQGNNDIGGQNGLYQAAAGYDMASGLGTPDAGKVLNTVCPAAGTYNPVTPKRLLDTRPGGLGGTTLSSRGSLDLQIPGLPSGVTAVTLNVTVTDTTGPGYLTVWPYGSNRPLSSNLNWTSGQTIPNLVTVPVGPNNTVSFFNGSPGTTDLVADLQGYYSTQSGGSQLSPVTPTRLLDTRSGTTPNVPSRGSIDLQVAGTGPVPAGATAVVLNVTAVDTQGPGFLTVWPAGATKPLASNLNWAANQVIPNAVVVPVGANGSISMYNGSPGAADLVVDVAGYFSTTGTGGKFHPAGPFRALDTRWNNGAPLNSGQVITVAPEDTNFRVPVEATSVVLNVTVTSTTGSGYLTVWPHGASRPLASNLNWTPNTTIANQVTVPVVNGQVDLAQFGNGTAHVVVDLFGYYS